MPADVYVPDPDRPSRVIHDGCDCHRTPPDDWPPLEPPGDTAAPVDVTAMPDRHGDQFDALRYAVHTAGVVTGPRSLVAAFARGGMIPPPSGRITIDAVHITPPIIPAEVVRRFGEHLVNMLNAAARDLATLRPVAAAVRAGRPLPRDPRLSDMHRRYAHRRRRNRRWRR